MPPPLARLAALAADRPRLVGTLVAVLAALTAVAFLALGANGPADPELEPATTGARRPLAGFGETAFRVIGAAGSTTEGCALLAAEDASRARGLMTQTDLRGYDAMVFTHDQPVAGAFFNRNVPVALTVSWFDTGGGFLGWADMGPCPDADGCPVYEPPGPWTVAVEVLAGDAPRLGIGPGARIEVGGACASSGP